MKSLTLLFLALISFNLSAQELPEFHWLIGTWERTNNEPGKTFYEIWENTDRGGLAGTGISMEGTDTVFVEKLRITERYGTLYYIADIGKKDQPPTFFKIISSFKTTFVSENPAHDFPQEIVYKREGNDLIATISAGEKEIEFLFVKVD